MYSYSRHCTSSCCNLTNISCPVRYKLYECFLNKEVVVEWNNEEHSDLNDKNEESTKDTIPERRHGMHDKENLNATFNNSCFTEKQLHQLNLLINSFLNLYKQTNDISCIEANQQLEP